MYYFFVKIFISAPEFKISIKSFHSNRFSRSILLSPSVEREREGGRCHELPLASSTDYCMYVGVYIYIYITFL